MSEKTTLKETIKNADDFNISKAAAEVVGAGLVITAVKHALRHEMQSEINQTLDKAFYFDGYLARQRSKEITTGEGLRTSGDSNEILPVADRIIRDIDDIFREVSFDSEMRSEAFEELKKACVFPDSSSEAVATVMNGYTEMTDTNLTQAVLDNYVSVESPMNTVDYKPIVIVRVGNQKIGIIRPFEHGFLSTPEVRGPKTVTQDGVLLVFGGVVGLDEKILEGNPKPQETAIHIFALNGYHRVPLGPANGYLPQTPSAGFAVTDEGAMFSIYDHSIDSVKIIELKTSSSEIEKVTVRNIDFDKFRQKLKGQVAGPGCIQKHFYDDGTVSYFWQFSSFSGNRPKETVLEENISADGTVITKSVAEKYRLPAGSEYKLLGRVGNTSVVAESNTTTIYGLVFIDGQGEKYVLPANIPVAEFDSKKFTVVKNENGQLAVCYLTDSDSEMHIAQKFQVDAKNPLYKKIWM